MTPAPTHLPSDGASAGGATPAEWPSCCRCAARPGASLLPLLPVRWHRASRQGPPRKSVCMVAGVPRPRSARGDTGRDLECGVRGVSAWEELNYALHLRVHLIEWACLGMLHVHRRRRPQAASEESAAAGQGRRGVGVARSEWAGQLPFKCSLKLSKSLSLGGQGGLEGRAPVSPRDGNFSVRRCTVHSEAGWHTRLPK
jgi:hypothetical protein